jgi:hypothetical protein
VEQGETGPISPTNDIGRGVVLTVLADLGEKTWNDVAIDEAATTVVFAGANSYLWQETVSGGKSTFSNNANIPKADWKSVALNPNGTAAVALPYSGKMARRWSRYVSGWTADNKSRYYNKAAMCPDGANVSSASMFIASLDGMETVLRNSNGEMVRSFPYGIDDGGTPPEYTEAAVTAAGDIIFSGDIGGSQQISVFTNVTTPVNVRLPRPSGVPADAVAVTRAPYNGVKLERQVIGTPDYVVTNFWYTNTYTEKLVGGPFLDVFVTTNANTKLYVRNMSQWAEVKQSAQCAELLEFNSFLHMTNIYGCTNVFFETDENGGAPRHTTRLYYVGTPVFAEKPDNIYSSTRVCERVFPGPDLDDRSNYDIACWKAFSDIGTTNGYMSPLLHWPPPLLNVWTNSEYMPYRRTAVYVGTNMTDTVCFTNYTLIIQNPTNRLGNLIVTNQIAVTNDRLAEAYQPIEAAGMRKWTDAAVSMDAQMRRIWATESGGRVWRMTGTSWQTGTWAGQTAPGTNLWKQVVCSADGERAIAVGDCMVPTGGTYGTGADAVPIEANAWYFDGAEWHPLYQAIRNEDGTVGFQKWKKAFISTSGYTAYLLPEGRGYVHKLEYQ